ncbi:restriction endonuclease subunit S [Acetobacter lovaniensis]|uniref:Type I restriction enzyme S subunit n=1 Tax=Acetobacter lovaniensis TaxID=104100 RepID=A0A841QGF9_9PROT|nr:restriction endonuclease subunit S [Acetobacter lovaniensis]MBB6457273.1 type I restriction enzyme S subunit [Acetobacter lovaniensis]GBQ63883.1 type I DNA specificity S subunit [Acetobacter lovaniensis NRIC 0474]
MLPEGWKEERLGDLCEKISDGIHTTPNYDENSDVFFVNGNNIQTDGLNFFENTKKVSQRDYEKYKKDIGSNTILMSINGTIGNTCLYNNERVVLGKSACYLNIKKSIDLIFILHSLRSSHLQNYFLSELTGTTIRNLSLKTIKSSNILLPPLPEQKKIAAILSTWDRAIEGTEELLANSQQQKKALMQQLLTGKKRLPGFTGEWETLPFKKTAQLTKGSQLNRLDCVSDGTFPVINGGITPSGYTNEANRPAGTITISEGGNSCGYVDYQKEKFWCGGHCYSVEQPKIFIEFLYQTLKFSQPTIMRLRVGSGLPNIQKKSLESLLIHHPIDTNEQKAIAAVLSSADEEITALESDLLRLRQEKKALMQQLLTGKRRVTVD